MNQRLEKELHKYCDELTVTVRPGDLAIARHFYSLALEDVRKEVERLKKCSQYSKIEWIDEGYNQNAFAEDCRIKSFNKLLSFIDQLSK